MIDWAERISWIWGDKLDGMIQAIAKFECQHNFQSWQSPVKISLNVDAKKTDQAGVSFTALDLFA